MCCDSDFGCCGFWLAGAVVLVLILVVGLGFWVVILLVCGGSLVNCMDCMALV